MSALKRFMLAIVFAFSIGIVASQDVKAEITNYPNGLSSWGFPVLPGIGSNIFADVNVYWVDSTDTEKADGAGGGTAEQPFATIDFAIGQCVANQGDVILVKPGHVETVSTAAGIDFDVAGITVIGIGNGSNRPTIKFTSTTTADIDFDAVNTKFINFLLEARVNMLAAPIDVNVTDTTFINIECRDITVSGASSTGSTTNWIKADANADRFFVDGFKLIGTGTTSADAGSHPVAGISLTGGDDIIIRNVNIYGNFSYGNIIATTTACVRLTIGGFNTHNQLWNVHPTDTVIGALTSTGFIGPNITCKIQDNAANLVGAVNGSSMQYYQPIEIVNLAGESSTQTPITKSTN